MLSNNDGCVVARTAEAKALGIKMGVPYFQIKPMVESGRVIAFSSNYELYGDLSARMMNTTASLVPAIEVYSIDECFADLTGIQSDKLADLGKSIKDESGSGWAFPLVLALRQPRLWRNFVMTWQKLSTAFWWCYSLG